MGTRGCVAIGTLKEWKGVYNHYDSYPRELGKNLWNHLNEKKVDFVVENLLKYDEWEHYLKEGKCSYCKKVTACAPHSIRMGIVYDSECEDHQHEDTVEYYTHKNVDPSYIEWIYIIDKENSKLHILTHKGTYNNPKYKKPLYGEKEYGNYVCWHEHVDSIDLNLLGTEIDFDKFEVCEGDE